jgi:hypothetical protein
VAGIPSDHPVGIGESYVAPSSVVLKSLKTELERLNTHDLKLPRLPSGPSSPKILVITQSPS